MPERERNEPTSPRSHAHAHAPTHSETRDAQSLGGPGHGRKWAQKHKLDAGGPSSPSLPRSPGRARGRQPGEQGGNEWGMSATQYLLFSTRKTPVDERVPRHAGKPRARSSTPSTSIHAIHVQVHPLRPPCKQIPSGKGRGGEGRGGDDPQRSVVNLATIQTIARRKEEPIEQK